MLTVIFVQADGSTVNIRSDEQTDLIPLESNVSMARIPSSRPAALMLRRGVYKVFSQQELTITGAEFVVMRKDERPDPTVRVMTRIREFVPEATDAQLRDFLATGARSFSLTPEEARKS
jgi:hypothetical protein